MIISVGRASEDVSGLSAYEGLHFVVGFMENEYNRFDAELDMSIFISTKELANIYISYPDGRLKEFQLKPTDMHHEAIPSEFECRDKSEVIAEKGIIIDSDVPITVYCFSSQNWTSDSYAAIPVTNWGQEYVVVSQPNNIRVEEDYNGNITRILRESEFMVLGGYDNTNVSIVLTDYSRSGREPGDTIKVVLDKGDCYQVQAGDFTGFDGDLTGTIVSADKPISVLSGHVRAPMPATPTEGSADTRDHLIEMLLPTSFWGKEYVSVPYGISDAGDYIRIVSKEKNVKISYKSGLDEREYLINNDKLFVEVPAVNAPAIWKSDKPIQIAQLMGHADPNDEHWNDFDPCMAMIPPREQYVQYVMFQTPGNVFRKPNQYKNHYVTLVLDEMAVSNIRLDGRKLDSANIAKFTLIDEGEKLYSTRLPLDKGRHILKCEKGTFAGVLFGAGRYDSYSMVLGASLREPGIIDSLSPVFNMEHNCGDYIVRVRDKQDPAMSGLLYAKINKNATYNFDIHEEPFKPGDDEAVLKAKVKDPYQQARLVVYGQDRAGNYHEEEYIYYRTNIQFPGDYDFGTVFWHDSICKQKSLVNNAKKTHKVLSAELIGDDRLSLYTDPELPCELGAGDALKIKVCFVPNYDSTALSTTLKLKLDCGIEEEIPIKATVEAPALMVKGHDFGKVLIGTVEEAELYIENRGNVDLDISKIRFGGDTDNFELDTNDLAIVIPPSENYSFNCKFKPAEVRDYFLDGTADNSADIPNVFEFKGEGVAPNFESITIDLKERRIGYDFDTTFVIPNTGNWEGKLRFVTFDNKSEDGVSSQYLETYSADVPEGSLAEFKLPVQIEKVGDYGITAVYSQENDLLPDVKVNVIGIGTLPEITKNDVYLADTDIYSRRDTVPTIIEAGGNEKLHIISMTILEQDKEIEFDISEYQDFYLQSGETFELPMSFYPTKGGNYFAKILIVSDAAPNYEEVKDTVYIYANARVPNIEKIEIELIYDELIACVDEEVQVVITNKGTAPINLDAIDLTLSPDESIFDFMGYDLSNDIPRSLNVDEKFEFKILLDLLPFEISQLMVDLTIFETEHLTRTFDLQPTAYPLGIINIPDMNFEIGQEYALEFGGEFPHGIDDEVILNFEINLPINEFRVREDTTYYLQYGEENYEMDLTINEQKLIFVTKNPLKIDDKSSWKINFSVQTLLGSIFDFDLTARAIVDDCYLENSQDFGIKLDDICVRNIRTIEYLGEAPKVSVKPNPVGNQLNLQLDLDYETKFIMEIFDINGKKIQKNSEIILQSGQHLLIYNLNGVPNGNYYLVLDFGMYKEIELILINK